MKRFTETTKWRDPWFRRLTPTAKLLWLYIVDSCNQAGVVELDLEAVSFDLGADVTGKHLTELEGRARLLANGKIFVPKFIPFQYGELSEACKAHIPIFKLISTLGLTRCESGFQYPMATLGKGVPTPYGRGKGKGKEKEGGMQGGIPDGLKTPEFEMAWADWIAYKAARREKLLPASWQGQLNRLAGWGERRAVAAIRHTIAQGWQGIFEPKAGPADAPRIVDQRQFHSSDPNI